MADYLKQGFSNFLNREFPLATSGKRQTLSSEDFDSLVEGISGSKITSGISTSKDGTLKINWDKGLIEIFEGGTAIIQLGKFDDGTKGIKILGGKGTQIVSDIIELVSTGAVVEALENRAKIYVDKKGLGGRNRLMVQFASGAPRLIVQQP